jgi:peptidoglycan glycosyltransferase
VLADVTEGARTFAADAETRLACLHAVGDAAGNIGSGALRVFAGRLSGYNPVTGVTTGGGVVTLSIDAALQKTAYAALAGRRGAVLVSNYETGEVLGLVSAPSYDPAAGFDAADPQFDSVYVKPASARPIPPAASSSW